MTKVLTHWSIDGLSNKMVLDNWAAIWEEDNIRSIPHAIHTNSKLKKKINISTRRTHKEFLYKLGVQKE